MTYAIRPATADDGPELARPLTLLGHLGYDRTSVRLAKVLA